jgi:hypothetical protein
MTLSTRFLAAAMLVAAVSAPSFAQTSEKSALAWTLTKGDKSDYALTWELTMKQGLAGPQAMELGNLRVKVVFKLDQTITAVEGDVASVSAKIKGIVSESEMQMMGMPMPKQSYDSGSPEGAAPMMAAMGKAVGETFTFKLTKQGKVSAVAGGDEIGKKVAAAMAEAAQKKRGGRGGPMGGMANQGAALGAVAFQNKSLGSALNLLHNVLPAESKNKDDTWKIKQEMGMATGVMQFTGLYKHDGSTKGKVRISFKNEGEVAMKKGGDDVNPMMKALGDMKVVKSKLRGLSTFGEGKLFDSEVSLDVASEGAIPPQLKQRMQMMGGGAEGAKLAIGIQLTVRLVRGGAKSGKAEKKSF